VIKSPFPIESGASIEVWGKAPVSAAGAK
jgi:hypothetical protein